MPNLNSRSVRSTVRRRPTHGREAGGSLERLLAGARSTFAERGYRAANIHEICARSNVGIGTFYAHFDHKRQLLQRVFIERGVLLSRLVTPADLLDHDRLVACLRSASDDPVAAADNGGADGWALLDRVIEGADRHLNPGGRLVFTLFAFLGLKRARARLQAAGLDGLAINFVDYLKELPYFAAEVLPRLQRLGVR